LIGEEDNTAGGRAAERREGIIARPVSQRLAAQRAAEPRGGERGGEECVAWPVSPRLTAQQAAEPLETKRNIPGDAAVESKAECGVER